MAVKLVIVGAGSAPTVTVVVRVTVLLIVSAVFVAVSLNVVGAVTWIGTGVLVDPSRR